MKLLVFAFKPPPYHGQSYMVQLLLECLGGDVRSRPKGLKPEPNVGIDCFHVDSRVSTGLDDAGRVRAGKVLALLKYCLQAIWCRLRYGVRHFYYVPAPPAYPSALYRDWIVMALCRPFFSSMVYHFHGAGLGEWLKNGASPWKRFMTRRLLGKPALCLVQTEYNRSDGVELGSRQIILVAPGIPDPCPEFTQAVLPRRLARANARKHLAQASPGPASQPGPATDSETFQVLFISLCTAAKGLFDAIEAVKLLNEKWKHGALRVRLTVAGDFADAAEREKFEKLVQPDNAANPPMIRHVGFVSGEQKKQLFVESDCLCFPTWYEAESFGLVLVEAMAFGLPIVTTRWRMIPELLPRNYPGMVEPHAPREIMSALEQAAFAANLAALRQHYVDKYTVQRFAERMVAALKSLEPEK